MSTKAAIGIENDDGTITGIYCYYDGYLEGLGRILDRHYQDEATVRMLIEGGNIKYIGDNFWATEFYIRDNNELNHKPQTLTGIDDFERYYYKIPYFYLFSKNKWLCRQDGDELLNYYNLSHAIELIKARNGLR